MYGIARVVIVAVNLLKYVVSGSFEWERILTDISSTILTIFNERLFFS